MQKLLKYGDNYNVFDETGHEVCSVQKDDMFGGYYIKLSWEGKEYRLNKNPGTGKIYKNANQAFKGIIILGSDLARGVFEPKHW